MLAACEAGKTWRDEDLVLISALEHWSYCPRQCTLIHLEQTCDENIFTLRGNRAHERAHTESAGTEDGIRVVRGLPLWSDNLGLIGKADIVEWHGETPYPVEYKVGKKRNWGHEVIQLCAQAICLEEMLGVDVPRGAIYYAGSRRREIARSMVAGKLRNSRSVLLRAAREAKSIDDQDMLAQAARLHADILGRITTRDDLDMLRGDEGDAARIYFAAFSNMVRPDARGAFGIAERSRRPPRDAMNSVLSFLYTLLRSECTAALEGVGLDPQVGYLHALRPGRPALALDLMEELRAVTADRLALTLVNRKELQESDFVRFDGGAVYLNDAGRRKIILAWQGRKEVEVDHRVLGGKTPIGLVPHLQARLLARHLRNDLEHYIPYISR